MYKLFLHPTERKSTKCLYKYLQEHKKIGKEFVVWNPSVDTEDHIHFSTDLSNPDLLVKKHGNELSYNKELEMGQTEGKWVDHCAMEHKFGMDCVNSLNSGLLKDELTRMKRKYSDLDHGPIFPLIHLYLVIVNEWNEKDEEDVIDLVHLARATTIAQNLNIRIKYCSNDGMFARTVFNLIRTPPSEVDLGQRFTIKSSGSEFNRSLQCYHGVTRSIADMIEYRWKSWKELSDDMMNYGGSIFFDDRIKKCFTTESGRFMKANMEKFLKKVSGK